MLAGDFARKLRKLNSKLRIYCGDDKSKPAGLYYIHGGQYCEICGVDKNYVPEFIISDSKGHIVKSGWRRVVNILVNKRLVDKRKAEKVFNTYFHRGILNSIQAAEDPILKMIEEIKIKEWKKDKDGNDVPLYHKDYLVDVGREIEKKRGSKHG